MRVFMGTRLLVLGILSKRLAENPFSKTVKRSLLAYVMKFIDSHQTNFQRFRALKHSKNKIRLSFDLLNQD